MLRLVIDGAGDLPTGWAEQYDIHKIPINIHFGDQVFLQGIDLSDADFYRIVEESGRIPQTSQPSPQQFIEFYQRVAKPGETILSIHVTSKLSGTFASAEMAARELKDRYNVIPFDSASGSASMAYMCQEVRQMEEKGASLQAILDRLDFIRRNVSIVLTLNTLEYARRSGRVKALQAALASILNVKPIIALKDGMLDMSDRVRTRSRAMDAVVDAICQKVGRRKVNLAVVHSEDPASGEMLKAKAQAVLNCHQVITTTLSIAVAANLGPGTIGLVAYPVEI